jgi:hypothetical protein
MLFRQLLPDLVTALQQLEVLDLTNIIIHPRDVPLLQSLPRLRKLHLPLPVSSETLPLLQGSSPLPVSSLTFFPCSVQQQQILACIQQARGVLQGVTMHSLRTPELLALVSALSGVGGLRELMLFTINLRPAVPALSALTQLSSLHIYDCAATADGLAQVLGALSGLRELFIDQRSEPSEILPGALAAVPELPHLTSLLLGAEEEEALHGALGALQRFSGLRRLELSGAPSLRNIREHIHLLTGLERLTLNMLPHHALAEAQVPLGKLRWLHLQEIALNTASLESRQLLPVEALAFTCLKQLKVLELSLSYSENCTFKEKVRTSCCSKGGYCPAKTTWLQHSKKALTDWG